MSTASWLSLLGTVVLIAMTWGSQKNEIGNLKTAFKELKDEFNRSREKQGERIERLERTDEAREAVRRATHARGTPVTKEGG